MKKSIKIAILCLIVAVVGVFTLTACKESDPFDVMNSKLALTSAAKKAETMTEVKTASGNLLYEDKAEYERIDENVNVRYTVTALNDNPGVGENVGKYSASEETAVISVEQYLKAIKANTTFDQSVKADGYGVDAHDDGSTTLTFDVAETAKAAVLGLTEEEAAGIKDVKISVDSDAAYVTSLTIQYSTASGNVVKISVKYKY